MSYGLPRAKVGGVERGKRAHLVFCSGDPLELSSFAEKVFTNVTWILPIPHFGGVQFVAVEEGVGSALAWPRLTIVNEALVVTWQERCSPATQWKVMARVLR